MNAKVKEWNDKTAIEKILTVRGTGLREEIYDVALAELAAKDAELESLRAEIDKALSKIHGARKTTASDPDNVWCRQATIILNEVYKELAATLERVTK